MTKAERKHLDKVAAFGCIACWLSGYPGVQAEIHHPRAGAGMGRKASHLDAIPLCQTHHRGIQHPVYPSIHLDKLRFIEQFGTEAQLLETLRSELGLWP